MAIQTINIGNVVNDGLGDDLRTAFQKVNANFSELNSSLTITASNLGSTGAGIFKQKTGNNLEFKRIVTSGRLTVDDAGPESIIITNTAPTAFTKFVTDSGSITAGVGNSNGEITLQGRNVSQSGRRTKDIEVTTFGSAVYFNTFLPVTDYLLTYDFGPITGDFQNAIQLAMAASNIDFGTITLPSTINLDCGTIV